MEPLAHTPLVDARDGDAALHAGGAGLGQGLQGLVDGIAPAGSDAFLEQLGHVESHCKSPGRVPLQQLAIIDAGRWGCQGERRCPAERRGPAPHAYTSSRSRCARVQGTGVMRPPYPPGIGGDGAGVTSSSPPGAGGVGPGVASSSPPGTGGVGDGVGSSSPPGTGGDGPGVESSDAELRHGIVLTGDWRRRDWRAVRGGRRRLCSP